MFALMNLRISRWDDDVIEAQDDPILHDCLRRTFCQTFTIRARLKLLAASGSRICNRQCRASAANLEAFLCIRSTAHDPKIQSSIERLASS